MNQKQVEVIQVEPLQRLVNGQASVFIPGILNPKLAGNEKLVTRYTAMFEASSDGFLILVGCSRVNRSEIKASELTAVLDRVIGGQTASSANGNHEFPG